MKDDITQKDLKDRYRMDEAGNFIGKIKGYKNYNRVAGAPGKGIQILGKSYTFARLRALYTTGVLPPARKGGARKRTKQRIDAETRCILTKAW